MRLEITRRSDLAVQAMLALAGASGRTKAPALAEQIGTTAGFVSQVMTPLVQHGWVGSEPGPSGGYVAEFDPDALSVLDVIEAIEGPTDSGRCVLEDRACAHGGVCALHRPWASARDTLRAELGRQRLASVAVGRAR